MKIQLKNTRISKLIFKAIPETADKPDKRLAFKSTGLLHKKDKNKFMVRFDLKLHHPEYTLTVVSLHYFDSDIALPQTFKNSDFIKINAPAIAYPYLRAFISNLTLQSGYEPAILPTLNFVTLSKKQKKE